MKKILVGIGSRLPGGLRDFLLSFIQATIIKLSPNMRIGKNVLLPRGSTITSTYVEIGDGSGFSSKPVIKGRGSVKIGKYCSMGNIRIITQMHDFTKVMINEYTMRKFFSTSILKGKGDVVIGNDVWIGDDAVLLGGITVGDGAVIGAGAVVTKDVPDYCIVFGVPAKVVARRFPADVAAQLKELAWWDWPVSKIRRNREFFMADLSREKDIKKLVV
jgi:acetyltransferase-like isoleucine patch superfamily enzyme